MCSFYMKHVLIGHEASAEVREDKNPMGGRLVSKNSGRWGAQVAILAG